MDQDLQLRARGYVQTWDGVVYLNGRVITDAERDAAESMAHEAAGGREVVSNLSVSADSGGVTQSRLALPKRPVPKSR